MLAYPELAYNMHDNAHELSNKSGLFLKKRENIAPSAACVDKYCYICKIKNRQRKTKWNLQQNRLPDM